MTPLDIDRIYVTALIAECEQLVTGHRDTDQPDSDETKALAQAATEMRHLLDLLASNARVTAAGMRGHHVGMAESDQ